METIQYAILTQIGGSLIADYSNRAQNLTFATNNRGDAECSAFVPMGIEEAFLLYDRAGLPHVQITDSASGVVFQGRLEDVALTGDGVTLTALGYARALSDAPYTALWSDSSVRNWRVFYSNDWAPMSDKLYEQDTNNRLFVGLTKGASYANGGDAGGFTYQIPDRSSRNIIGVQFEYSFNAPTNWKLEIRTSDDPTQATGSAVELMIVSAGALLTGARNLVVTSRACVSFYIFNGTGGVSAPVGESGTNYLKITGLRLVSTTANRINTTLGTIVAGPGVATVTPGSMTNIKVGARLNVGNVEVVLVAAVTVTAFTATFTAAHGAAEGVQGFAIYADEIAKDLVAVTSALNPTQLSTSTLLIDSPALDLLDEVYEDRRPSDILDYLTTLGDLAGNQWEWGVKTAQRLYFRAQHAQRTWYIDASTLDVQRLLDQLRNSVYAVYSEAGGRSLRTAATADAASVARYGLTRRQALNVSSTSATQAGLQQAAALFDGRDPKPRSGITITRVFDSAGAIYPLWAVAAGDTVIMRNLSPTLGVALDRIRVFRLSRAAYDATSDSLSLEPESPLPSLEALIAQRQ